MKLKIHFILIILFAYKGQAQQPTGLNQKAKTEVVHTIADLLIKNYVYSDTALKMAAYITKRHTSQAYKTITDPSQFSGALNNDLYKVYHDGHLLVQYNPGMEAQLLNPDFGHGEEDPLHRIQQANFGFTKVEILNGNIGYIQLDRFWADNVNGRQTVKAALQFVAHTNALIIDIRYNGGGSPETVTMICSYFFKDRIHTNDTYNRAQNSTIEYWTTPDTSIKKIVDLPLYILTSNKTFSAAEEFAYNLSALKRAVIVGEYTGGGAHNTSEQPVGHGFVISIPYGKAVNAITKSNWEGTGVKPDILVPANEALETAELRVFENLLSGISDSTERFNLTWQ